MNSVGEILERWQREWGHQILVVTVSDGRGTVRGYRTLAEEESELETAER